jgi:hypothetical protein
MNLDKDVLELNEICNALVDGTITASQKERLNRWLAESADARRFYIRYISLSASLCSYAEEMQTEAVDRASASKIIRLITGGWWFGSLALAASVVFAVLFWVHFTAAKTSPSIVAANADKYIARVTGSKDCVWKQGNPSAHVNNFLREGQSLDVLSGYVEVTFDCGAVVVVQGPASLDLNSAWDATLHRGILKASVPPEALGFRISSAAVDVVDFGTEFSMYSDGHGAADVLVLKGLVEASPREKSADRSIMLRENQSRHFAAAGISNVDDRNEKFLHLNKQLSLDRFVPATKYVHWSFDETAGGVLKADAFGQPLPQFDAELEHISAAAQSKSSVEGHFKRALRFNGHLYAKASLPGISGLRAHTLSFWVKVPESADLSSAYAMVAWGANSKKLGSHPVHVGWNRNPTEGAVGVLRTDYRGGFALGATPLRDGHWHHIAVVFVPGEDEKAPVEIKQYVDGRFEGEGKPSPPGTEVSAKFNEENTATVTDAIWFGCRVGNDGPRKDRFRGEIDELFIADRALGPSEIVQLMRQNTPLLPDLASAKK